MTGDVSARAAGRSLWRRAGFWLVAALLTFFLFGASAPSPLYSLYQQLWGFSSGTLTLIYAVYAFGALGALLITGRVSDHVGRRPVTIVALVVQIAGMLAFIAAGSAEALFLGRVLQGVGTGMATGALSAWLLDLQPDENPRLGSVVGATALVGGLALGSLASGLLVEFAPDPLHLVFWLMGGIYAIGLIGVLGVPDLVVRRPEWRRSLRPEIGVPPSARSMFAATAPSLIATWAVAGLYLSLGPSLADALMQSDNRFAGGLVIAALLGVGAVTSFLYRAADPSLSVVRGSVVLIVGIAITLLAVAIGSIAGLFVGSVIAGLGFGPAFSGAFRSLAPLAPPGRRGALLASIYVVVYLAFSVPSIVAGFAVSLFGLRDTTLAYGLVVMALAATTTLAVSRRRARAEQTKTSSIQP